MKTRLHKNYYWLIVAVVLLQMAICGGTANNLSGLHVIPVTEYLGISRSQYALGFSLRAVLATVTALVSGFVYRRFGYKKTTLFALLLYVIGHTMLSFMEHTGTFIAALAILGLGNTFCSTAGATYIISKWFRRKQGTVLGLVTASTGIGGSVLCIFQTQLMESYSWRASYLLCGITPGVILLLMLLIIRNDPKDVGLVPYGQDAPAEKVKKVPEHIPEGSSMKELYRKPAFYMMLACTLISCIGSYLIFGEIVPHLTGSGFSATQAGSLQSLMLLLLSGTKLLTGYFCDRWGARKVTLVCMAFGVASSGLLAVGSSYFTAAVAVVLYTFALPITTIIAPLLALPLFGYRAQPQYTGIFLAACSAGQLLGSLMASVIYDAQKSYRPAFALATAICVVSVGLYLILFRMTKNTVTQKN